MDAKERKTILERAEGKGLGLHPYLHRTYVVNDRFDGEQSPLFMPHGRKNTKNKNKISGCSFRFI